MGRSVTKVFLICPVRNASEEQRAALNEYICNLENGGYDVFYPTRNNRFEDTDSIGVDICNTNCEAIRESDEVHIFFDPESRGTLFDIGCAFAMKKPLKIANLGTFEATNYKSFTNVILNWPY